MGLDISIFKPTKKVNESDYEDIDDCTHLFMIDFGLNQQDTFEPGYYEGNRLDSFRAGSYSGYNGWRKQLAEMIGIKLDNQEDFLSMVREHKIREVNGENGLPFIKLIFFSDCESYLGPKTCEELYRDFMSNEYLLNEIQDTYFKSRYQEWKEAFKTAYENNGVVIFS